MALVGKKRPKKILSPMDLGDKKTRREYAQSGPVTIYKAEVIDLDNISIEELIKLPGEEAQKIMTELCNGRSDVDMAKQLGVSAYIAKSLREQLSIVKDRTGVVIDVGDIKKWPPNASRINIIKNNEVPPIVNNSMSNGKYSLEPNKYPLSEEKKKSLPVGLYLTLCGGFTADKLYKKLETVMSLLAEEPDNIYNITFILQEADNE